jgi:hypothetical protein
MPVAPPRKSNSSAHLVLGRDPTSALGEEFYPTWQDGSKTVRVPTRRSSIGKVGRFDSFDRFHFFNFDISDFSRSAPEN